MKSHALTTWRSTFLRICVIVPLILLALICIIALVPFGALWILVTFMVPTLI